MGRLRIGSWIVALGLLSRFFLIFSVTPKLQSQLYTPFLASIDASWDPWNKWLLNSGAPDAFPYGLSMIFVHTPQILLFKILAHFQIDSLKLFTTTCLLLIMVSELLILRIMYLRKVSVLITGIFYLNPLFMYLNYAQGANDILPAALLVVSAHLLCNKNPQPAGFLLGIAIGMKFSLALTLPFFALYAYDNPRSRTQLRLFLKILLPTAAICYSPIVFSEGFRKMLGSSFETSSLLSLSISVGDYQVAVFPMIFIFLMYWLWKVGRTSIDTLLIFSGTVFIAISILSPTTPGWLLWGFPLIMLIMQPITASYVAINAIFMCSYSIFIYTNNHGADHADWFSSHNSLVLNISFSMMIGFGAVLVTSSLRQSLDFGDVYSFGKNPIVISIAGDSGVGKDTLSSIISDAFGAGNVTEICGDDFHRFERVHPIWKHTTHLDPLVNNLKLWEKNLRLARQRETFYQQTYDHEKGIFTESKVKSKADLVISQGLHALYTNFDSLSDFKIFISMDENLRVAHKISRDVSGRGKTREQVLESIVSRAGDSFSFIQPQRENADLVIDISSNENSEITIEFWSRNPTFVGRLYEILEELDFSAKTFTVDKSGRQTLGILTSNFEGATAIRTLESNLMNFNQLFQRKPNISDGYQAVLAMVVFLALDWEKGLK